MSVISWNLFHFVDSFAFYPWAHSTESSSTVWGGICSWMLFVYLSCAILLWCICACIHSDRSGPMHPSVSGGWGETLGTRSSVKIVCLHPRCSLAKSDKDGNTPPKANLNRLQRVKGTAEPGHIWFSAILFLLLCIFAQSHGPGMVLSWLVLPSYSATKFPHARGLSPFVGFRP